MLVEVRADVMCACGRAHHYDLLTDVVLRGSELHGVYDLPSELFHFRITRHIHDSPAEANGEDDVVHHEGALGSLWAVDFDSPLQSLRVLSARGNIGREPDVELKSLCVVLKPCCKLGRWGIYGPSGRETISWLGDVLHGYRSHARDIRHVIAPFKMCQE